MIRGRHIDKTKGKEMPAGFPDVVEVWLGRGWDVTVTRTGVRVDKNRLNAYNKKTTRDAGGPSVDVP